MALLEAEITTALLADSTLAGLVGTRVFPFASVPAQTTFPLLVYQLISSNRDETYTGAGFHRTRYQFDAYSRTYGASAELIDALKTFMPKTAVTWGSQSIGSIRFDSERDAQYDTQLDLYVRSCDYFFWVAD